MSKSVEGEVLPERIGKYVTINSRDEFRVNWGKNGMTDQDEVTPPITLERMQEIVSAYPEHAQPQTRTVYETAWVNVPEEDAPEDGGTAA